MDFLVYTPTVTPRIQYTCYHILSNMLGFNVIITQQQSELSHFKGPKLSYSQNKSNNCINITPHTLLLESKIIKQSFAVTHWNSLPILFETTSNEDIPFDIFAATFFLISRYEEYITEGADIHRRFEGKKSIAYKYDFLNIPLVDLWVKQLGEVIEGKFPDVKITKRKFTFLPTIDIDNAYAYKHKGFTHNVLAFVNSIIKCRFNDLSHRIEFYFRKRKDPYDTYNRIFTSLKENRNAIWFILGGRKSKFDRNISISSKPMHLLLQKIANEFEIGVHPSYASNSNAKAIAKEISALSTSSKQKITKSRQHFLKLSLPETYRSLVKVGITEDYTMGYSNVIGFRASTCTPFTFYDLKSEKELPLRIVPFQVMDVALLNGLKLSAQNAIAETLKVAEIVKNIGGCFVTIWHNESISGVNEWKGWEDVLERVVAGVNQLSK
jgi:hypothetical protein